MDWLVSTWNYLWDAGRTHPFNFVTLLFSLVAIIISLVAWKASQRQAKAGERQAQAAEKQALEAEKTRQLQAEALKSQAADTARALEIAARSAEAAEVGAQSMNLLAQPGQRPWVTVEAVEILKRDAEKLPIDVVVRLKNGGRTPALGIRAAQWFDIADDIPANQPYPNFDLVNQGNLGPGSSGAIPRDIVYPADPTVAGRLFADQVGIFIYGIAKYRDIFGGDHETRWAFRYRRETGQFRHWTHHNEVT